MKKLIHVALLFPFLGQAQTAQVHIAGSEYPVIFADTNLSFAVRQRIATDLTLVFSPVIEFDEAQGGEQIRSTVSLPGGGTAIERLNGRDYWEGVYALSDRHALLPSEELCEGFFIVDYNNEKSVRVSTNASARYQQAFALVEAHSNAVQLVTNFVALVNAPDLLAKPPQVLRDMFNAIPWAEDEGPFSDENILEFLAEVVAPFKCPGVSVLHFAVERRPEIGNAEVLVMWLHYVEKANPSKIAFPLPILFHNGRWGIGRLPEEWFRGV